MKIVVSVLAGSILLSGCALAPDVPPFQATLPTPPPNDGSKPLKQQTYVVMTAANARQGDYLTKYQSLNNEQKWRDVAILAAGVGLSATTVFRGDANSLKYAGYAVGLTGFYDKAIPLSARIAAAKAAVNNYNALIVAGTNVLGTDIDGDLGAFNTDMPDLSSKLAVAKILVKGNGGGANPCGAGSPADCWQTAYKDSQQQVVDAAKLQASIDAGTATLAKATSALADLKAIPGDMSASATAIEKTANDGVALVVDQSIIDKGVVIPKAPVAAPAAAIPPAMAVAAKPFVSAKDDLDAATVRVQTILDRADYSALAAQIKAAAPAQSASPPAAKPGAAANPA